MKTIHRFLLTAALCGAAATGYAQIPMPGWSLSDMFEAQCGVANYTYEKFDFSRFPLQRNLSEYVHLGDTVRYKKHIYDAAIRDSEGPVGTMRFQSRVQVTRDTVTFVSAANEWLEVSVSVYLAANATEAEVDRAVDSLQALRTFSEDTDILPANQDGVSYALQYLFARSGIDAQPVLSWRNLLLNEAGDSFFDYCCERVRRMKVGSDIERFARRMRFSEEYLYVLENSDPRRSPIAFFRCDGKFWMKLGMSQYTSYDSVISVWRHDKKAAAISVYRLRERFRRE